jgi:transposase
MDTLPTTIEECHQVIRLLLNKLDGVCKRLDILETENKKLRLENTQLKERLNNNSSNSSLPRKRIGKDTFPLRIKSFKLCA